MSNLFAGVETTDTIEEEKDFAGRQFRTSDLYEFSVKQAYFRPSAGGSIGLILTLEDDKGGLYTETIYITNRNKQTFYVDKKSSEKKGLPGFLMANTLSTILLGIPDITKVPTERKLVELWSKEANQKIPVEVDMIVDMIGKRINAGIIHKEVNKSVKQGDAYVLTNETQEENEINKFFSAGELRLTAGEIRAEATEEDFVLTWLKANQGKLLNRVKKVDGPAGGARNTGGAGTPSLFG